VTIFIDQLSIFHFQKSAYYAGTKIFHSPPSNLESLTNRKAQFKVTLKLYLNTHSFYSVEEFLMFKNDLCLCMCMHVPTWILSFCFWVVLMLLYLPACFEALWLIPHPVVASKNLWIHGMYVCVCIIKLCTEHYKNRMWIYILINVGCSVYIWTEQSVTTHDK
jgi:hypothetical protein